MTYKLNGTSIPQPTTGKWINRRKMGDTGDGHPVYPGFREFELTWNLIDSDDFATLQNFFNSTGVTGTVVAELPKYGAAWQFYAYSGCVLEEPEVGDYFQEHINSVKLLIARIQT